MNNIQISENFKLREFECRCCGAVKLEKELLDRLQAMRTEVRRPMIIRSAFRCPSHNSSVGGAVRSQHLEGKAVDFWIPGLTIAEQRQLAEKYFPNDGVGYGNSFTHVDTRGFKARWSY